MHIHCTQGILCIEELNSTARRQRSSINLKKEEHASKFQLKTPDSHRRKSGKFIEPDCNRSESKSSRAEAMPMRYRGNRPSDTYVLGILGDWRRPEVSRWVLLSLVVVGSSKSFTEVRSVSVCAVGLRKFRAFSSKLTNWRD
jgi:hypothetical protein